MLVRCIQFVIEELWHDHMPKYFDNNNVFVIQRKHAIHDAIQTLRESECEQKIKVPRKLPVAIPHLALLILAFSIVLISTFSFASLGFLEYRLLVQFKEYVWRWCTGGRLRPPHE